MTDQQKVDITLQKPLMSRIELGKKGGSEYFFLLAQLYLFLGGKFKFYNIFSLKPSGTATSDC